MTRVAPYAVDVIDATPTEVDAVTRRLQDVYDAPVVVHYRQPRPRTSDRIVRNRVVLAAVAFTIAAAIGLNGPLWSAMPWSVTP